MKTLTDTFAETRARLLEYRHLSYPKLAAHLGYPRSAIGLLSDVAHGRHEHVNAARLDDLRQRLGLPPAPPTVPAVPCPTCQIVHGDGYDCHGARIQIVRRRPHPTRIQDMSVTALRAAILNRQEIPCNAS